MVVQNWGRICPGGGGEKRVDACPTGALSRLGVRDSDESDPSGGEGIGREGNGGVLI